MEKILFAGGATALAALPDCITEEKPDKSICSNIDKQTQWYLMIAVLRELTKLGIPTSEIGFLSEEGFRENLHAHFLVIMDPVDGTKSMVAGGDFCIMVQIYDTHEQRSLISGQYFPRQERFVITDTYDQDNPICYTRQLQGIRQGVRGVFEGDLNSRPFAAYISSNNEVALKSKPIYDRLMEVAGQQFAPQQRMVPTGPGSLRAFELVNGLLGFAINCRTHPWDILPLLPLIKFAGGVVYDLDGKEFEIDFNNLDVDYHYAAGSERNLKDTILPEISEVRVA
jgi:fructose-1,6-bisphosphatase/inositol monophosphatase family enzyme